MCGLVIAYVTIAISISMVKDFGGNYNMVSNNSDKLIGWTIGDLRFTMAVMTILGFALGFLIAKL